MYAMGDWLDILAGQLKSCKATLEDVEVLDLAWYVDGQGQEVAGAEAALLEKGATWPQLPALHLVHTTYTKQDLAAREINVPAWGTRGSVDVSRFSSRFRYARDLS